MKDHIWKIPLKQEIHKFSDLHVVDTKFEVAFLNYRGTFVRCKHDKKLHGQIFIKEQSRFKTTHFNVGSSFKQRLRGGISD